MRKPSYKTVTLPTASLTTVAVGQPLESSGGWGPVEMHCSDLCLTVPSRGAMRGVIQEGADQD